MTIAQVLATLTEADTVAFEQGDSGCLSQVSGAYVRVEYSTGASLNLLKSRLRNSGVCAEDNYGEFECTISGRIVTVKPGMCAREGLCALVSYV